MKSFRRNNKNKSDLKNKNKKKKFISINKS